MSSDLSSVGPDGLSSGPGDPRGQRTPLDPAPQAGNGPAVAALLLGILSLGLLMMAFAAPVGAVATPLGFLMGYLAILFGAGGRSTARKKGGVGRGVAIAGTVLGLISVVFLIMALIVIAAALSGEVDPGGF